MESLQGESSGCAYPGWSHCVVAVSVVVDSHHVEAKQRGGAHASRCVFGRVDLVDVVGALGAVEVVGAPQVVVEVGVAEVELFLGCLCALVRTSLRVV